MISSRTNCNIWFTSDTHYAHKNICRGISEWKDKETKARDFKTLEKMNWALVNAINSYVMPNDILYHLGDWSFGGIENIWPLRQQIACQNIHLITGNHDKHIKKNTKLLNCSQSWFADDLHLMDKPFDSSNPDNYEVFAQELFTSVQGYLELTIDKQIFVLSHYPIDEWFEMDRKGGIMLHGHCHHALDDCEINMKYKRMDVGIDWNEFRPYSLEEIVQLMRRRELKKHNS